MKKLLIINKEQFGYHTDAYKWCQYLADEYEISYFCFDSNKEKLELPGVEVRYVSSEGGKFIRGIRFILLALLDLFSYKGLVIVIYFKGCSIFKSVYKSKPMILDVRTLSIDKDPDYRKKYNYEIKYTCEKYDYVTIISEGTRNRLSLSSDNSFILPLGADAMSVSEKSFNKIRLLYVGTFEGRSIDKTIEGLHLFVNNHPDVDISYEIVGDGISDEKQRMIDMVAKYGLEDNVHFYGWIPHWRLSEFFDRCNIGVSFIPLTDYYDYQPPTKTFEYVLSGLVCIATNTSSNREVITQQNGILINDSASDFSKALEQISENSERYDSRLIRETLKEYKWSEIVNKKLRVILNHCSDECR